MVGKVIVTIAAIIAAAVPSIVGITLFVVYGNVNDLCLCCFTPLMMVAIIIVGNTLIKTTRI